MSRTVIAWVVGAACGLVGLVGWNQPITTACDTHADKVVSASYWQRDVDRRYLPPDQCERIKVRNVRTDELVVLMRYQLDASEPGLYSKKLVP